MAKWIEIKPPKANAVIRQHDVAGELVDWWLVELEKDGGGSAAWGFSTKRDAENALELARGLMRQGLPRHIDYKVMYKTK